MAEEAGKKVVVTCYRELCEFNDSKTETCVNDELSIGQSGICLCIDDAEGEEGVKIHSKKGKKHVEDADES